MNPPFFEEIANAHGLTRQEKLFPKRPGLFDTVEQYSSAKSAVYDRHFEIRDDLLYESITYGEGLSRRRVPGFTRAKGLGYVLLSFFVQQALGVYRLPYCPDRILSNHLPSNRDPYRSVLAELTPARVNRICDEVRALYAHTQDHLKRAGLDTVRLRRCVHDQSARLGDTGYAELLFKLARACRVAGRTHVDFEMDVINSWGDDGSYVHFPVQIVCDVPAADVLYCSNLIRSREDSFGEPGMAVESGEWVVLNRSPTGVVSLPIDAISLNTHSWVDRYAVQSDDPERAAKFIASFEPVVLRNSTHAELAQRFPAGGLVMKAGARIRAALQLLLTGRDPFR